MSRIAIIAGEVGQLRGLTLADMRSSRQSRNIARARHEVSFFARRLTMMSLPEIGRRLGGRDPSTVLHGIRRVEDLITVDAGYAAEIESLRRSIAEKLSIEGTRVAVAVEGIDTLDVARRIVGTDAEQVVDLGQIEIRALAAALLAEHEQHERLKAEPEIEIVREPARIITREVTKVVMPAAMKAAIAAHDRLKQARFTAGERAAQTALDRALNSLKAEIGDERQVA